MAKVKKTVLDKKKILLLDREYEIRLYKQTDCNKRIQFKPALIRIPCKLCGKKYGSLQWGRELYRKYIR